MTQPIRRFLSRALMVVAALLPGAALRAEESALTNAEADLCPAEPTVRRIQVLVELADTPTLDVYRTALASASVTDPARKEAAARASERAQDQKIKDAQARVWRDLAGLGARELYRVRRSFNGISIAVGVDKLGVVRALSGVKAIYPRLPEAEAALASGLRAYVDPATGRLTSAPTDAQVRELDRRVGDLADRSSEGLEVVTQADGSQVVFLQGRFRSLSTASVSPDGVLRLNCLERRAPGDPDPRGSAAAEEK